MIHAMPARSKFLSDRHGIPDHIDRNDFEALADWVESDDFQIDPGEFRDGAVLRRIGARDEAVERARRELDDEVAAA